MTSFSQKTLDLETALTMVRAAVDKARELSIRISVVVVDASGQVKAALRMDNAAFLTMKIAEDKAYSAAGLRVHTHLWHDAIKDDPPLRTGIPHIERLVTFGGGFAVREQGEVIGAIG